MTITITATQNVTYLDGVKARVWEGITDRGTKCIVFVHRVAVANDSDCSQFDQELAEQMPPGRIVELRHIL